jgi:asparagine synthase (glutamine-hydrolysing)
MRDCLVHRGPDEAGAVFFSGNGLFGAEVEDPVCGLGHRRLSILDLTPAGNQPLGNEDGTLWITYNGEIYNFLDFRSELESRGHRFKSFTDTEVILHLVEERGIENVLNAMNGMWAFGLYDTRCQRLILARDRMGKKPLYYAEVGGGLIFASEMKALYASGLIDPERLDEQAVAESLRLGTPLAPRTMLEQIRLLPQGHYAIWESGRLVIRPYYTHPMERLEPENRSLDDFADEFESLLADAIRIRLIADVPVGLFLSGGVDSSLIAAVAAKRLDRYLHCYSISFEQKEYNEAHHAQAVADYLQWPLHVYPVSHAGPDLFEKIARHIDQPIGDASLIPTYLVSQSAHAAGVKAVLTGDGGDELFGGYSTYRVALDLWAPPAERNTSDQARTPAERAWTWRVRAMGFERGYLALQSQFSWNHRLKLYRSPWKSLVTGHRVYRRRREPLRRVAHRPLLDRMQYSDMQTLMVDVILRKMDLMSMANSVECRSPLLDYRLVELAARLPVEFKMQPRHRGKILLRLVLGRYLPTRLYERPKMGF